MKTAKQSFSKEPYVCLKEWETETSCQCGGAGLVFTEGSLVEVLSIPPEQVEVIKEVLDIQPNKAKKSYKTAFFEAFPDNPRCFIRGEGATIEEAENAAWEKWQKIKHCEGHEWDRRTLTNGYAYCTKCPLKGKFLEPSTRCLVCGVPSCRQLDNTTEHYCIRHYLDRDVESVSFEEFMGMSTKELACYFQEEKSLLRELDRHGVEVTEKSWEKFYHSFLRMRGALKAQLQPFFSPALKTNEEIHETILNSIPTIVAEILKQEHKDK